MEVKFELNNNQRGYLGLDPIMPSWDRVSLKGDTYRQQSILYFEGNTIKRYITSTENHYSETQYNELTKDRNILLPKTSKGKEKKLTASALESIKPIGVYFNLDVFGNFKIGNHTSQTTFYSNRSESNVKTSKPFSKWIDKFIENSHPQHQAEIEMFKLQKRKNVKFKAGDYFAFKLNRTEYGFGRVLLDIGKLRKKNLLANNYGLSIIMTLPVLVKIYAYISKYKNIDVSILENIPCLPSDYMMDNALLYGEYEIIGHKKLDEKDFEFPMSYGKKLGMNDTNVFFQWGLISIEKPIKEFNKYLTGENFWLSENSNSRFCSNPFGYYSIGFKPYHTYKDINDAIKNSGIYRFHREGNYKGYFDLRNPDNIEIRNEIMFAFGLDPEKSYSENCIYTNTANTVDIIDKL